MKLHRLALALFIGITSPATFVAKSIYLAHRGANRIAQDFAMLQEVGTDHPLMNGILARKE